MKFLFLSMVAVCMAAVSLSAPLLAESDDSILQSLSEALQADSAQVIHQQVASHTESHPSHRTHTAHSHHAVHHDSVSKSHSSVASEHSSSATHSHSSSGSSQTHSSEHSAAVAVQNVQVSAGASKGSRYVRFQSAQAHFQVSYVSVQTSDGKVVSAGKQVTSNCGQCGFQAQPNVIVNGNAEARSYSGGGVWHASGGSSDWIEIDLGNEFPVSKVVFYNRDDCCRQRSNRATLTLLNSKREQVDAALLNEDKMQIFNFDVCGIESAVSSYKNNHAESTKPMLQLLCNLEAKIKNSQVSGQVNVAQLNSVASGKQAAVVEAETAYNTALSAAETLANEESTADVQRQRELNMIDSMIQMIHALNGKPLGNSAATPIVDIAGLVGRASGFYFVKPNGAPNAAKVYVDNDRNGGGWVLVARVTTASCQAHMNRAAVGLKNNNEMVEGPTKEDDKTTKFDDEFIQELRSSSSARGTIGFWMEAQNFGKDTFISSQATVNLQASANTMSQRTNLATSYRQNAELTQTSPNEGTRGFGHHHPSSGTFFAWGRHPEEGNNCGFRSDNLGSSNGFLWVR